MPYSANHGFLPQTLGQDGDPTDAIVLMQNRLSRPRCSPPALSVSSTSLTRAKTTTGSSVSTSTTLAIARREHTIPLNDLLAATVLGLCGRPLGHNALRA
jgi:hypothetical protein